MPCEPGTKSLIIYFLSSGGKFEFCRVGGRGLAILLNFRYIGMTCGLHFLWEKAPSYLIYGQPNSIKNLYQNSVLVSCNM